MPDAEPAAPPVTIVLAIDGLRAAALGAYGQTSYETPAFDAIAAEGTTYDWAYAPTPKPNDLYAQLAKTDAFGGATLLATDEPEATAPVHGVFDRFVEVDSRTPNEVAASIAETTAAAVWTAFAEALVEATDDREPGEPLTVWLHTRGLRGPWDAPAELFEPLVDEDDPEVVADATPPDLEPESADDAADARFAASCRYAAQVMTLDACLDGWLDIVEGVFEGEGFRLIVVGLRGFSLGEHGRIGGADGRLFSEVQHTPLLVRDGSPSGRFSRIAEPTTLDAALASLLAGQAIGDGPVAMASDGGVSAVRTPEWLLRLPASDPDSAELYVKPDDRWEQNDVASLELDAVDELSAMLSPSDPS